MPVTICILLAHVHISEILASNRGFSGLGYWTMSVKFFCDRPWLPWQRNLGQNWL